MGRCGTPGPDIFLTGGVLVSDHGFSTIHFVVRGWIEDTLMKKCLFYFCLCGGGCRPLKESKDERVELRKFTIVDSNRVYLFISC